MHIHFLKRVLSKNVKNPIDVNVQRKRRFFRESGGKKFCNEFVFDFASKTPYFETCFTFPFHLLRAY